MSSHEQPFRSDSPGSKRNLNRIRWLLRELVLFTIFCLATPQSLVAQVRLPDLGDSSEAVVNQSLEREIGEAFMRELRSSVSLIEDPLVGQYIQQLGHKLTSSSAFADHGFEFFVVDAAGINAFAAPGGFVGVNSGLILAAENESELASVLAHEIAHVTQRHIARGAEFSGRNTPLAIAGMLAALIVGTQNPEAGRAAAAAVQGLQVQSQIDFTRGFEQEADRVGITMLDRAGFEPQGMAEFFGRLQTSARYYRSPPEFLSTHPVTTARIAEARSRAEQFGYRQHPSSLDFYLVRATLRVRSSTDSKSMMSYFDEQLKTGHGMQLAGAQFGRALLAQRSGAASDAERTLIALDKQYPESMAIDVALARARLGTGKTEEAVRGLENSFAAAPQDRMVTTALAEALLGAEQYDRAYRVIDEHERLTSLDSTLLKFKAQALDKTGRTAESQLALAEHFHMLGQLDEAIAQLRFAAGQPNTSFYDASRIEARLEQLEKEHAERLKQR